MFFRTDDDCVWHSESPYPIRRVALRAGLPRAHPLRGGYQDLGSGARDDTAAQPRLRDGARAGGAESIEDQAVNVPALDEREAGRRRTAGRTAQRLVARLIDLIERAGYAIPHVCYHPQVGPVQTCDTCMVEQNGSLIRACSTRVADGMSISTKSAKASVAQVEAFDRILSNHLLYCTVCDNNNGNCAVHNTTKLLAIEHQRIPFRPKPYEVDSTNPFYRYDPSQCILCGRCVEACQNVEVNETLSINWEDPNPRVLWDGGSTIGESSCVSCGHCVTVCPCMPAFSRRCGNPPSPE